MPLLDHFRPGLEAEYPFESFHSAWANVIAFTLNEGLLPERYHASPHIHIGPRIEIDVATFERLTPPSHVNGVGGVATMTESRVWTPTQATLVMPATFSDSLEVQISRYGNLIAAIELVSPSNKDRPENRRAFALKCASYLSQGVSLVIVDIVTERRANLHDELVQLLPNCAPFQFPETPAIYATAYRPVRQSAQDQIEVWLSPLAVGQELPTLPLHLDVDLAISVDLESTYTETRRKLRLPG